MTQEAQKSGELKRVFTAWTLTIYGVGSILGAGIYAVIGKVAGVAGHEVWLSFLIAMVISVLTGLTYAELGSRFPKSGAEAHFFRQAFDSPLLSSLIGWMVLAASIVSVATLSHAFAGYVGHFLPDMPHWPIFIVFILILGSINFWGIQESSGANMVATAIEFSGLLMVLVCGLLFIFQEPSAVSSAPKSEFEMSGVLKGVALAFFAFIGFEDLVNVADEVKNPKRNLPIAIMTAAIVAGLVYIAVSFVASRVISPEVLANSSSPLLEVVRKSPLPIPDSIFTVIALFAVSNTALLNSITASRLLYGMSRQKLLPKILGEVHSARKTPYIAISLVIPAAIVLAVLGSLELLAGATSMVLLTVFFCMNVSLTLIKTKEKKKAQGFHSPMVFSILGAIGTFGIVLFVPWKSQVTALGVILLGLMLLLAYRRWGKS